MQKFEGTLIVVSHDRSFIKRVSTRILEIKDGGVEIYPGTYDDYLWSLEKGSLSLRTNLPVVETKSKMTKSTESEDDRKFNYKEVTKKLNSEIKELQRKILKTEEIIIAATQELSDMNGLLLAASGPKAQQIAIEIAEKSKKIHDSEEVLLIRSILSF